MFFDFHRPNSWELIGWMARLPVNNVTENVPKRDAGAKASELDQSSAFVDKTRPVNGVDQAKGSGGEPMTAEARRQYINLKRVRYQASASRGERGQMLRELVKHHRFLYLLLFLSVWIILLLSHLFHAG